MESPLNETTSHHYKTRSNGETKTTERPKMQRRLSSYDRNEHKRTLYNNSNTFITTATTVDNSTTITKDTKDTNTHSTYFGFSSSPIKNVDNNNNYYYYYNESSGKEITENFFKKLDSISKEE
ncbi:uncharacterized protein OCT59_001951 [Rhizophagus irregularis]|uniref:Uncharacterized protein n=1 Tax=Rhizophagus irregularis (strain DAOM 197198w) TaxID=1432141 RepID=A0A015KT04_RHIIW|nr:hypothetical protein RirG_156300 [Rhizophagus irregularis DAOM 197198w]UZO10362.1 hypothetical protein OCT59_001951 [Rhizophagus irregularis]GBC47500.1 hypothetical protein RIR_jg38201.t1 [Rhizophagus irregularis DAOM 181602=DAOM 197198]